MLAVAQARSETWTSWCASELVQALPKMCHYLKPWGHQGWQLASGASWSQGTQKLGKTAWLTKLSYFINNISMLASCFGLFWGSCSLVSSWPPTETSYGVGRQLAAPPVSCWHQNQSTWCWGKRNPLVPPLPTLPQNYFPPSQRDQHCIINLSRSQSAPVFSLSFPYLLRTEEAG